MPPSSNPSRDVLPRVLAASRFVTRQTERDLVEFERGLEAGFFESAQAPEMPSQQLSAPEFVAALRKLRNTQMARLAFRDIAGWADLDETLGALSDLADRCCQAALQHCEIDLQARYGRPRDEQGQPVTPVILGLGKLGGRELNFSSDIDLIFCFTAAGETDGAHALSNEQYFGKLAQAFTRYLSELTPEGFVFRVDWMLRPFGSAGPPAISLAAMEEYYQSHGREWERYALIKARSIAGDRDAGQKLLNSLRPFVYRRYLDFNAIGHLRELKQKIDADAQRRGAGDDLKLGPGGIREVEFIVQSFQLMRGGQEPRLRNSQLRPVLRYLGEAGHIQTDAAQALDAAYAFLRRAENAVQLYDDQQTHRLPDGADAQAALCAALNLGSWDAFTRDLEQHRATVRAEFARVFAAAPVAPVSTNIPRSPALTQALQDLREQSLVKSLSESSEQRLMAAVNALLSDASRLPEAETAALRVLEVIAAIAGRSTYLALLRDSALAREHLLKLCAASPWLTRLLAQSPGLLDQLLDPRVLYEPPQKDELRAELVRRAAEVPAGDTEAAMNLLRRYVQETTLRIAAADLVGTLPLVQVSDRLTWLAESVIECALLRVQAELTAQHGPALKRDGSPAGFAVVAYGKFGGLEMGYGSDLDVVFVHDCDALDAETPGARKIANEVWLARLGQRLIHWLSTQTGAGRAYEVDIELRPDGRRGLTVSSLPAFAEYQRKSAWTWEHQALTRARFIVGDTAIGAAFTQLRREMLCQPRDAEALRRDVLDMRTRMQQKLDTSSATHFDIKQGRGGITDIEFITQFLVLRDAQRHPLLADWSDNWRQLDALEQVGSVSAADKEILIAAYRAYRAAVHARSLQNEPARAPATEFTAERDRVRRLWERFLERPA